MRVVATQQQTNVTDEVSARESAPDFGISETGTAVELSLTEIVTDIRMAYRLDGVISAADVLASLTAIVAAGTDRQRWVRAFSSPLGRALIATGRDVNTALGSILARLPRARN